MFRFAQHDSAIDEMALAKVAELLRCFDVTPRPAGDVFLFVGGELAADFRRRSEDERAGRNFHPNRDQCVCANDGARADLNIVENNGTHANQHFVVDLARVDDGVVPDSDQLAHGCRLIRMEVNDGIMLNI